MVSKNIIKKGLHGSLLGKGSVSVLFRNCSIALFVLALSLMLVAMITVFHYILRQVSIEYARTYAVRFADAISAHNMREIALVAKAARSRAVIDWLTDEYNDEKKIFAYEELSGIIGELYSNNLYVGLEKSLNEYRVGENYEKDDMQLYDTFDKNDPDDVWFFGCIESDKDYVLNIGIDYVLERKRVWLNYKVAKNGVPLGVICTELEFSLVVEGFFPRNTHVIRGLIIDANGIINFDSYLLDDDAFKNYELEVRIENRFTDPVFNEAIKSHLGSIEGYFDVASAPTTIENWSPVPFRYATIVPIRGTDWSVVMLSNLVSWLGVSFFLPVFAIMFILMLILLIAYVLAFNTISYRLVFLPLEQLISSLTRLKGDKEERIYGLERNDEFGSLSNTIQNLFTKTNHDTLTGIYNRWFMEDNLPDVIEFLSRSNSFLSVLMLDVDFFKEYNDTYGHEQGDACIKAVAKVLTDRITRKNDFVIRYGGDEFIVVLPNTDEIGARQIAQNLLENMRKLNLPHAKNVAVPYVSVSIGITTCKVSYTHSWEDYLKRADDALYMSKQNGRNQYSFSDYQ